MKPEDVLKEMVDAGQRRSTTKLDLEAKAKELGPEDAAAAAHGRQPRPGRGQVQATTSTRSPGRLQPAQAEQHRDLRTARLRLDVQLPQGPEQARHRRRSTICGRSTTRTTRTTIKGLPPGPIGNPGEEALKAALNPTKGTGSTSCRSTADKTLFAETNEEHERNREKYAGTSRRADNEQPRAGPPCSARPSPTPSPRCCTAPRTRNWASTTGRTTASRSTRRRCPASSSGLGPRVGRAVADHAAQAGGHPAARRDQRDRRLRRGRQHGRLHRGRAARRRQHRHPRHGRRAARARRRAGRRPPPILGAGATASSALAALARICTGEVTAYVRSEARADEMRQWGERLGVAVRIGRLGGRRRGAATRRWSSPPPRPAPPTRWPRAVPERPGTLFDVLYDPWPTALAAAWSARGGAVVGGLDLLVHQAVLQVEQMTGRAPAPLAAMRAAGERGARRPLTASGARSRPDVASALLDRRPVRRARTWEDRRRRARAAHPVARVGTCDVVPGASMRSTVEQVALADRGGVARPRTGRDAGGSSRRRADHHGDGGGRTWPGGGSATAAAPG